MKRNCFRKVKRYLKEEVIFKTLYTTKKLSMFCSSMDEIPTDQKVNLIYRFTCPGCNEKYIGKTDRNIITRLHEYGSRIDQPLHIHLTNCDKFGDIITTMQLPNMDNSVVPVNRKEHILNAVMNNFSVVNFCPNYSFWKLTILKHFNLRLTRVWKHHVNLFYYAFS